MIFYKVKTPIKGQPQKIISLSLRMVKQTITHKWREKKNNTKRTSHNLWTETKKPSQLTGRFSFTVDSKTNRKTKEKYKKQQHRISPMKTGEMMWQRAAY